MKNSKIQKEVYEIGEEKVNDVVQKTIKSTPFCVSWHCVCFLGTQIAATATSVIYMFVIYILITYTIYIPVYFHFSFFVFEWIKHHTNTEIENKKIVFPSSLPKMCSLPPSKRIVLSHER
jgi:hypothetical protein